MNNKQIKYAIALSKSLNFSQVAQSLGISQPALSKQISLLEKELDIELFDRHQNPIKITSAGEFFLSRMEEIIYNEEQVVKTLDDFKTGKKGTLTIGVSPFRALYLLPDICNKIREKFPEIKIILSEDSSDNLRAKASEGKYDFAIVNLPVDDAVLDITPIEKDELVIAVPKNYTQNIKIDNNEIEIKELKNIPFIVVGENQEMRVLFDKMCKASDFEPNISAEVVGLTTAWAMARQGIGATLLPLSLVKNLDINNELKLYTPSYKAHTRQPVIITKHGQYISDYAKYAIKLLTK